MKRYPTDCRFILYQLDQTVFFKRINLNDDVTMVSAYLKSHFVTDCYVAAHSARPRNYLISNRFFERF